MISFAKIQVQGRTGKAVKIGKTTGEKSFARFSIATTESYKKDGEWVNKTHWHNCITFNPATVAYIERNLTKGREVWVSGDLKTDTYEKDGQKLTSYDIHIDEIQVGAKTEGSE